MSLSEFLEGLPFPSDAVRQEIESKLNQEHVVISQLSDITNEEFHEIGIFGIGLDILKEGIRGDSLKQFLQVSSDTLSLIDK